MEFKLNCPCGQVLAVPASAAGSSLPCACGRTHQVPSLSELRKQAGLPAFRANAVLLIEDMKAGGELLLPECLGCGRDTDETVVAIAECEKAWTPGATSAWWLLVGFLFLGIWVFILRAFSLRDREGRQFGDYVIVQLPFHLCGNCRRPLQRSIVISILWISKFVTLAGGVLEFFFWPALGACLVLGALLLHISERAARKAHQEALKKVLRRTPIYERLFGEYPDAQVISNL